MNNERSCADCHERIEGAYVGNGNGTVSHPRCYYLHHPPRVAVSLGDVVHSSEDPVLSRQLCLRFLNRCLTVGERKEFVNRFNIEIAAAHARRIAQ